MAVYIIGVHFYTVRKHKSLEEARVSLHPCPESPTVKVVLEVDVQGTIIADRLEPASE